MVAPVSVPGVQLSHRRHTTSARTKVQTHLNLYIRGAKRKRKPSRKHAAFATGYHSSLYIQHATDAATTAPSPQTLFRVDEGALPDALDKPLSHTIKILSTLASSVLQLLSFYYKKRHAWGLVDVCRRGEPPLSCLRSIAFFPGVLI